MTDHWNPCVGFLLVFVAIFSLQSAYAAPPAIYIFGDSTADVGTNNKINDVSFLAKADYPFNGIDFPGNISTGRFSNGFNSADSLCKQMGFAMSPGPFLYLINQTSLGPSIMKGVNFASAGAGILDDTGAMFGKVITMNEQIQQFGQVSQELEKLLGADAKNNFLSKSVFFLCAGSNDVLQQYMRNRTADKQEFLTNLTSTYEYQLKMLYSLGARKFGIISAPPIGCCPSQRVSNTTTRGCMEELNMFSRMFFSSVQPMLQNLSSDLQDMKYSLGNAYEMVINMMDNPSSFNFTNLDSACCGYGTLHGEGPCLPSSQVCPNRDKYLFWDWYHPSQAASELAAQTLYNGGPRFVTPINFKQLQDDN